MIAIIRREIAAALAAGLNLMIETVTDLVFNDNGTATGKGILDQEIDAAVGYHFGFYSRPNDGATGVVVKLGGKGANSVLVSFRDTQYELSLSKGEVGIKNAFEATILLNKDGEIVLNDGTKKVARVTDAIVIGKLIVAGSATIGFVPANADGIIGAGAPSMGTEVTLTGYVQSTGGADKVKA